MIKYISILSLILCLSVSHLYGQIGLRVDDAAVYTGDEFELPVYVETTVTGENVLSYQLAFSFSSQLEAVGINNAGSMTEAWGSPTVKIDNQSHTIQVAAAGTSPLDGTGTLFMIRFKALSATSYGDVNFNTAANVSYFNEGSPSLTFDNGRVTVTDVPTLSVNPSSGVVLKGESLQFSASAGTAPYTYSLENTAVGSINAEGLFTAESIGFSKVLAEDSEGIKGSTTGSVEVRGFRLSLPETTVYVNKTVEIPLQSTSLDGLGVVSGDITISHGNNAFKLLNVITAGTVLENADVSYTTVQGNTSISFASAAPLAGSGDLLILELEGLGTTSLSFQKITFNESLAGMGVDGRLTVNPLPDLVVSGGGSLTQIGEQLQYSVSGGEAPYTWSVNYPSRAAIDENGLLTATRGGEVKVRVEDVNGATGESSLLSIYDTEVAIAGDRAPILTTYNLPVTLDTVPSGSSINALELTFSFRKPELAFLSVVQAGSLAEGWSITNNAVDDDTYKIAMAGTAGITKPGVLFWLRFELTEELSINEVASVTIDRVLLNEGTPIVLAQNGSITGGNVPPTAQDGTVDMAEDTPYTFQEAVFGYQHLGGNAFTQVKITSLPLKGSLLLNGAGVNEGQDIAVGQLSELRFVPAANENGTGYASLQFKVYDGSEYSVEANELSFNVSPVNDAPLFNLSGDIRVTQDFTTTETVSVTPEAVPADENSQALSYGLSPESVTFATVSIDAASGTVSITAVEGGVGTQSFTVIANDGQSENNLAEAVFNLVVASESGNTAPLVAAQQFTVPEKSTVGTIVGSVVATDEQGEALSYSISGGNEGNTFAINSSTGELSIADNTLLLYETNPSFVLTVAVSDGSLSSSASVTVNLSEVANVAPTIAPQSFSIAENSPAGTAVGTIVASDIEGDALSFSIIAGNTGDAFVLDASTGALSVQTSSSLDYENTASFALTVSVSDGELSSEAVMAVNLTDLAEEGNDRPSISSQTFTVAENSANATVVGKVAATDADGDVLSYSISAGNEGNTFAISNTGELSVADNSLLDFETNPSFSLTVTVNDGSLSASASITIEVTDVDEGGNTAPQIAAQSFIIAENSVNATVIGTVVATDAEGDVLTYSITAGNEANTFAISNSGELTVADNVLLDFETNPSFVLTVAVSDGSLSASASITVELTDVDEAENTAPQIEAQAFSIAENSANATVVGTVVASDPEGDVLSYSINAGNESNTFAISSTGELSVADNVLLDFETNPAFSLTVEVSDGKLTSSAAVTVSLTDLAEEGNDRPTISSQSFTLAENSANATVIGTVVASDPEGDVMNYSITAGNEGNTFAINSNTGELSVADNALLDFETNPSFVLTVAVSDGGFSATASITVELTDEDEAENTAPQIADQSFSIAENSTNATVIGTVVASDPEGDVLTYSITDGNTGSTFAINSSTGQLSVAANSLLDFETNPTFSLTVVVSDGELSANAIITVKLTDVDEPVTGIEDEIKKSILLYPNPVQEYVMVEFPAILQGGTLSLYTLGGSKVLEQNLPELQQQLDLRSLNAGLYILKLQKGDVRLSFRLSKAN